MGEVAFAFGSYVFAGTNALIHDINIRPRKRIIQQTIPLKDGAHIDEARLEPLVIDLKGSLSADTQAGLRILKDAFLSAVCTGSQKLAIFDDRFTIAQKKTMRYKYQSQLKYMPFDLSFISATPFFLAGTASQDVEVTAVTGGTHNYSLNTVGSAYALPTITIQAVGAISNFSLRNATGDEQFGFAGIVLATASLIINTALGTVQNSGLDALANFSGDFLSIISGTNALEYIGGDCLITFDWTERWY